MAVQTGIATIKGIPDGTNGATITWSGYVTLPTAGGQSWVSADNTYSATVNRLENSQGRLFGLQVHSNQETLAIDFIPQGGTTPNNTFAAAAAAAAFPSSAPLKVQIAGSGLQPSRWVGDWIWLGEASVNIGTNPISYRLTVFRPIDHAWATQADAITSLTTAVS